MNALKSSPKFLQKSDVIFTGIGLNLHIHLERTSNPLLPSRNTNCPFIDSDDVSWISFYFIALGGQVCTSSVKFILSVSSLEKRIILCVGIYECAPCAWGAHRDQNKESIPWNWHYRLSRGTLWVLGSRPGSPCRGTSALNGRVITPAHKTIGFTNAFHPTEDILSCHLLILKLSP